MTKQVGKRPPPNPTGKGGFKEHPENINLEGAPKRAGTWGVRIGELTNMTREEAIEFVGKNTRIGRLLRDLPPKLQIKDALIFATIIAYGRDPNARMLNALMDREDGKVTQAVELTGKDGKDLIPKEADDTRREILRKLDSIAAATGANAIPEQPE